MPLFRTSYPVRRDIKTKVTSHSAHRDDLRKDFNQRCGYCDDRDYYKITYYEIDHFVPEDVMVTMSNTAYANLVYACRSCNNSKRAKWPSGDENVAILNEQGFIDPCDEEYAHQFERDEAGRIVPKTTLGRWMYVALKLSKPQHQIIHQLEILDSLIAQIENEVEKRPELEPALTELLKKYRRYIRELREI